MPRNDVIELSGSAAADPGCESPQAASDAGLALPDLFPAVYGELRRAARRQLAMLAGGGTLSTTGLVHEVYLKLAAPQRVVWKDRGHFAAFAALAMRHVLLDRAKARMRQKRAGMQHQVTLEEALIPADEQPEVMLLLSEAIDELARIEPRLAQVVDCRFFGEMREEEIAEALGITVRTVQRDWTKARLWLRRALADR